MGSCRHSFVFCCISLSISIACFSILLINYDCQTALLNLTFYNIFYYIVIFSLSFICVLFLKALGPIFLGIYVLYTVIFSVLFIDSYDIAPSSLAVKNEALMHDIDVNTIDDVVQVISLSPKNLLFLPKVWVSDSMKMTDLQKNDESIIFAKTLARFSDDSFPYNCILFLSSLVLEQNERVITIPKYNVYNN